jgi:hypothetical protein
MRKLLAASCITAFAVAAFIPASAGAAPADTHVTIKIKTSGNGFRGKVKSPRASCVDNRKVILERRNPGQNSYTRIGSDRASSTGSWIVKTKPVDRAKYRAVVHERSGASGCDRDASQATKAHETTATIAMTSSRFHGKVSSVSSCLAHRKVLLQRKKPGESAFHTIGSDRTNQDGKWSVSKAPVNGSSYRAGVRARQASPTTSCMRGRSPTVKA